MGDQNILYYGNTDSRDLVWEHTQSAVDVLQAWELDQEQANLLMWLFKLDPLAIIAGGAVRDPICESGRVSDIDVWLDSLYLDDVKNKVKGLKVADAYEGLDDMKACRLGKLNIIFVPFKNPNFKHGRLNELFNSFDCHICEFGMVMEDLDLKLVSTKEAYRASGNQSIGVKRDRFTRTTDMTPHMWRMFGRFKNWGLFID